MMSRPHESQLLSKGILLLLSQYGSMVVSIFFTFWLARLLGPSEFGQFAIGVFSFDIFNVLTDWGWEQGIFLSAGEDKNTAYATHLGVRFFFGSFPILALFGAFVFAPSLVSINSKIIASILALAFLAEKLSLTYKTILEREFALKRLAFFEFIAMFASYVCTVISVYAGFGYLALPLQRLLEKAFVLLGYVVISPWKMSFDIDLALVGKWIKSFGLATWGGSLLGLFLYDFVGAFIGVSSGVYGGGLYARSFKMATLPLMVTAVFGRITTPLYALAVNQRQELKDIFLRAQLSKACLIIPVQLVLMFFAPWWIVALLGEQWRAAVVLYQVLAIYGLVRAFYDDLSAVFVYGLKYPWIYIQQHAIQVFGMVLSWLLLKNYYEGAILGALVMSGGMVSVATWMWVRILGALHVGFSDIVRAFCDIFFCVGSMILTMYTVVVTARASDGTKKNSFNWRALFKV